MQVIFKRPFYDGTSLYFDETGNFEPQPVPDHLYAQLPKSARVQMMGEFKTKAEWAEEGIDELEVDVPKTKPKPKPAAPKVE